MNYKIIQTNQGIPVLLARMQDDDQNCIVRVSAIIPIGNASGGEWYHQEDHKFDSSKEEKDFIHIFTKDEAEEFIENAMLDITNTEI